MNLKTVNNISDLYNQEPVKTDAGFTCPVCKKLYKRETSIKKHMEKRECFDAEDMFSGTLVETKAYTLYKAVVGEQSPNARVSLRSFRKSPYYSLMVRYTAFCGVHEVKQFDQYYAWCRDEINSPRSNSILSECLKESNLRRYRTWLHANDEINTDEFLEKFDTLLECDAHLITRCIEKALINANDPRVLNMVDSDFPLDCVNRIELVREKVEYYKSTGKYYD